MNSSKGSRPRIERESGGKLGPSLDKSCPFASEWAGDGARRGLFRGGEVERGCIKASYTVIGVVEAWLCKPTKEYHLES